MSDFFTIMLGTTAFFTGGAISVAAAAFAWQVFEDHQVVRNEKELLRVAEARLQLAVFDGDELEQKKQTREIMFCRALLGDSK
jgi:hypothetical protein